MPRKVEIFVPVRQTDELLEELQHLNGLVSLRVIRGGAIKPPGDFITLELTNRSVNRLLRLLDERGIGHENSGSITTSEPFSLISGSYSSAISSDINDVPWEEMKALIETETNMNANMLILMFISGVIAVIGIATNAVHLVIGAMVIAPGFQPLVHLALGIVAHTPDWRQGLFNTVQGYAALLVGAAFTTLLLPIFGIHSLSGQSSYLEVGELVAYWSNISPMSIITALVGGIGGAILIATRRSVLTAGVMITLALIPSATFVSMGLIMNRLDIAGKGLLRWFVEASLVVITASLVLAWKQLRVQRRRMFA